ncbi:MAG: HlyD family efflux transporter periplasmic adaptor subunit [Caldilineaceae bacterium]
MVTVSGRRFASFRRLQSVVLLALLLSSCTQQPTPTPPATVTPLPSIQLRSTGGVVKASGKIVPVQMANLSFPAAGQIVSLTVAVGDEIQTGELLVALDSAAAQAAVAQAEAAVEQSKANLALLQAPPRAAEIAAAQAKLDAAKAALAQLKEAPLPSLIDAAKADLAAAQAAHQKLAAGASEQARINARTTLSNTQVALQQAQTAYDQVAWRQDAPTLPEGIQLQLAKNNYESAQALFVALDDPPSADQIAAADAKIQQAQAALTKLQTPPTANQLAEAGALVQGAQAALDLLKAGPQTEAVIAATAALSQTESALQLAQQTLAAQELHAPFAGTVAALNIHLGEAVLPGQALLTLADLHILQIETTDLSERDVARVAVGQPVTIFVEASGSELKGRVLRIAPQAATIGGDVVFPVTIALDEQRPELRWGMSVQVEIEAE